MDFIRFFLPKNGEFGPLIRSLNALAGIIQGSVESGIEGLESQVAKLNTVVDTTSESPDYALSVNETAVINITAATTPLNVAFSNGKYEIDVLFDVSTFTANSAFGFQGNDADHAGEFVRCELSASTVHATDEVNTSIVASDRHLEQTETGKPIRAVASLVVMGGISHMSGIVSYLDSGANPAIAPIQSQWNTALTALTIFASEVATGICYVKRIA